MTPEEIQLVQGELVTPVEGFNIVSVTTERTKTKDPKAPKFETKITYVHHETGQTISEVFNSLKILRQIKQREKYAAT